MQENALKDGIQERVDLHLVNCGLLLTVPHGLSVFHLKEFKLLFSRNADDQGYVECIANSDFKSLFGSVDDFAKQNVKKMDSSPQNKANRDILDHSW